MVKPHMRYLVRLSGALLLACIGAAGGALAQEAPPLLHITRPAETPPQIDGRLDDRCWLEAAQTTGFVLNTRREHATEQTTAYVTYDSRHLYVAFECLESQMDRLQARVTERDGQVFKDDVVEVFLDPNRDRFTYYQFAINPLGARFDLKGDAAGKQPEWDAPWSAAAARGEDRWWAEFAIPFSSLDIHLGKTSDIWGLNLAREQKPKGELSVWSFTGGAFGQPARFGQLSGLLVDFSRYAYGVEVVDPGERLVGTNALKARITGPTAGRALVSLENFLPDGKTVREQTRVEIQPGQPATVVLPYHLPREGLYRMVLRVREPNSGETLHATGVSVSIPPLLEMALYPNHYRQEVWLRPRLNVRQSDLKEFRLTARLLKNDAVVPPVQEVFSFVVKEPTLRFSLANSGPGDYEIQVTLAPKRSGTGLVKDIVRFSMAPVADLAQAAVSIHADNTLLVGGRRFFPLGIYGYGPGSLTEQSLGELRDSGFNLVRAPLTEPEQTRQTLDLVQAHGMMAWVPLSSTMEIGEGEDAKRERLKQVIPALASHPALLCWESADEPAWSGRSAEALERGYRLVRTLDPNHPVWTNHAPRNSVDELARFNRATDIAGADIYPVPEPQTQSDLPNKTLAVVGDETSKNLLAVLNRKPLFMVLQGFAWADLARRRGGTDPAVYPTRHQSRFMAYQAIVRGARGLAYWGVHYTPKPSPFWNDLRSVVFELSQMQSVLAGPNTGDVVKVLEGGKAIETLVRRPDENRERFIIAVNTSAQPVRARLEIPRAMPKVTWRVLFEERTVVGNPIEDHFEPYAVHIYTASTAFPKERYLDLPPVAEAQRPRPEDLTQAGNLLLNPGFEYAQEGDDAPVGWNARPALSGAVASDVKRTGKFSLSLQGRSPEAQPLWVQSGLMTEAGRRYRLTAHVRTRPEGLLYRLYAEWTDAENNFLGGYVPPDWTAGVDGWQEKSIEFRVTHPQARRMYVVLQLRGQGQAWFDDVRLEEVR